MLKTFKPRASYAVEDPVVSKLKKFQERMQHGARSGSASVHRERATRNEGVFNWQGSILGEAGKGKGLPATTRGHLLTAMFRSSLRHICQREGMSSPKATTNVHLALMCKGIHSVLQSQEFLYQITSQLGISPSNYLDMHNEGAYRGTTYTVRST